MPNATFFNLPQDRRERLVAEAILEFADCTYAEASLSQIAVRARIPKGSFYQYFEDKLDLYRWLLTQEAPRRKRAFLKSAPQTGDFWQDLETTIELGMAFLVEHPHLARLSAAAADPSALPEVRGLHRSICDAGLEEMRQLLAHGMKTGALHAGVDLEIATQLVSTIIGPGLTAVVLQELGAQLHEVLASNPLRKRLGPKRRLRLAQQAVRFIRGGLGCATPTATKRKGRAP